MGVLDDLIKIKQMAKEDDLLKLLDELDRYEKLSKEESLKDLHTSEITRKKCPLLAALADGNSYERILGELSANVCQQVENAVPEILQNALELTEKQKRQRDVLKQSIIQVEYRDLSLYAHAAMKDQVLAVFVSKDARAQAATAVIIIKSDSGYTMYHGIYETGTGKEATHQSTLPPVTARGEKGTFTLSSYSVLGNNAYPFGIYRTDGAFYKVMLSLEGVLYLERSNTLERYVLTLEEKNRLMSAKKMEQEFADAVLSLIESNRENFKKC